MTVRRKRRVRGHDGCWMCIDGKKKIILDRVLGRDSKEEIEAAISKINGRYPRG